MRVSRWSFVLVLATVVVVASAHVTVSPRQVNASGYGDFVLKVPTERPVPTVKLMVEFPTGMNVARLRVKQGWTAAVERDTAKAIRSVTWSGGTIGPEEFDEFAFSARIAATAGDTLAIKAYQTYQDGEVVAWADTVDPESRRPAPMVTVIEAASPGTVASGTSKGTSWMSLASLALAVVALTIAMRNKK